MFQKNKPYFALIFFVFLGVAILAPPRTSHAPLYSLATALDSPKAKPQILGAAVPPISPPRQIAEPSTKTIGAKSFLVYDSPTEEILLSYNPDFPLPIASLTKLMTAFVVYQHADFEEVVTVGAKDTIDISPTLNLRTGDKIKIKDLLSSMLVGSANDAALALSNFVSTKTGKKFVALMNEAATELQMQDSHFSNPLGFDSDTNYSTAHDLQKLVSAVRKSSGFGDYHRLAKYNFVSEGGIQYNIPATNKLLTDPEIAAIKTGFTAGAGGAMITEVTHEGHSFVIIVVGSASRENDTIKLKNEILSSYKWQER